MLWRVLVGSPTGVYDGHYNWSSPLIVNGYAYVGVASFGDCPLIQGQLIQVNLATGTIQNTSQSCSQRADRRRDMDFSRLRPGHQYHLHGDGNRDHAQPAVGPSGTGHQRHHHGGHRLVEAAGDRGHLRLGLRHLHHPLYRFQRGPAARVINKNGYMYAFNRNSLSSGPIWQRQIAIGGDCPTCGDSSVSSAAAFGSNTHFT